MDRPSLTDCRTWRVILDHEEQMLGLTQTPSGVRLEDVEKESREKGYSIGAGYSPKGKFHTSPEENEKQVFSYRWLATEKHTARSSSVGCAGFAKGLE